MKKFIFIILIAAFAVCCFALLGFAADDGVPRMSIEDLKQNIENPEFIIIDVNRDAVSKVKIKGAIKEQPLKFGAWISKYPKDKTLVLYCT
ncbi:MAG: rhodanese-like domain-containing protein [Candidatus Magnetoovum sp. WYHC-5]|nr:rhodanese-like domain-containing protein [Candidatus Magnetoovum sp. WYHC-5]